MNDKKVLLIILGLGISAALGAGGMYLKNRDAIEFGKKYPAVLETYDFMKDLECGAAKAPDESAQVNSYLKLYDDKYTFFEKKDSGSPEFVRDYINTAPTACGCGFEVDFNDDGKMYFSAVDESMQAYKQGIRTGDVLVSVDGNAIETCTDARKILGKDKTVSEIVLDRGGEEVKLTFTRYNDTDKALNFEHKMIGDTLYVKFDSMDMVKQSAITDELKSEMYDSLIIDLRGNGGGYTQTAVAIADLFVNKIDVNMNSLDGEVEIYSTSDGIEKDVPIVLLVGEKTASAAEIFTALMKQGADTTIVGTTTFGKGIYQEQGIFKGGTLRYTAGEFIVGDWENWHGKGIKPDVEVEMDSDLIGTDEDIQFQKALELLG